MYRRFSKAGDGPRGQQSHKKRFSAVEPMRSTSHESGGVDLCRESVVSQGTGMCCSSTIPIIHRSLSEHVQPTFKKTFSDTLILQKIHGSDEAILDPLQYTSEEAMCDTIKNGSDPDLLEQSSGYSEIRLGLGANKDLTQQGMAASEEYMEPGARRDLTQRGIAGPEEYMEPCARRDLTRRGIAGSEEYMVERVSAELSLLSSSCPTESYLTEANISPLPNYTKPVKDRKASFLDSMMKTMNSTRNMLHNRSKKTNKDKTVKDDSDDGVHEQVKKRSKSRLSRARAHSMYNSEGSLFVARKRQVSENKICTDGVMVSQCTTGAHRGQCDCELGLGPSSDGEWNNHTQSCNGKLKRNSWTSHCQLDETTTSNCQLDEPSGSAQEEPHKKDVSKHKKKFEKFRKYLASLNIGKSRSSRRKDQGNDESPSKCGVLHARGRQLFTDDSDEDAQTTTQPNSNQLENKTKPQEDGAMLKVNDQEPSSKTNPEVVDDCQSVDRGPLPLDTTPDDDALIGCAVDDPAVQRLSSASEELKPFPLTTQRSMSQTMTDTGPNTQLTDKVPVKGATISASSTDLFGCGSDNTDLMSETPNLLSTPAEKMDPKVEVKGATTSESSTDKSLTTMLHPDAKPTLHARHTAIGKLQASLRIDPTTLLPGATPPTKVPQPLPAGFDEPVKLIPLSTLQKDRVKGHSGRRPPTRKSCLVSADVTESVDVVSPVVSDVPPSVSGDAIMTCVSAKASTAATLTIAATARTPATLPSPATATLPTLSATPTFPTTACVMAAPPPITSRISTPASPISTNDETTSQSNSMLSSVEAPLCVKGLSLSDAKSLLASRSPVASWSPISNTFTDAGAKPKHHKKVQRTSDISSDAATKANPYDIKVQCASDVAIDGDTKPRLLDKVHGTSHNGEDDTLPNDTNTTQFNIIEEGNNDLFGSTALALPSSSSESGRLNLENPENKDQYDKCPTSALLTGPCDFGADVQADTSQVPSHAPETVSNRLHHNDDSYSQEKNASPTVLGEDYVLSATTKTIPTSPSEDEQQHEHFTSTQLSATTNHPDQAHKLGLAVSGSTLMDHPHQAHKPGLAVSGSPPMDLQPVKPLRRKGKKKEAKSVPQDDEDKISAAVRLKLRESSSHDQKPAATNSDNSRDRFNDPLDVMED